MGQIKSALAATWGALQATISWLFAAQRRQVILFAPAAVALLHTARSGAHHSRLMVLLAVFLVVSTLWIRGEYARDLDGEPWTISNWLGWPLMAAGAGTVIFYLATGRRYDGLELYGLIAIYFGSGALTMHWRAWIAKQFTTADDPKVDRTVGREQGLVLLVLGFLCYATGATLLGHRHSWAQKALKALLDHPHNWVGKASIKVLGQPDTWGTDVGLVLLVLGVVVFGPLGLSALASIAITWLSSPELPGGQWNTAARWGGYLGAVIFVIGGAAVALWSNSPWLLVVMLALGCLMVAQASPTQADIVAVIAVVALMGVTPADVSKPSKITPDNDSSVLLALGDSYMSGEGAETYFSGTDDGGGDECRRSPTSWAVMASHLPPFTGLIDLACSGATTTNVDHDMSASTVAAKQASKNQQKGENGTQLDQYAISYPAPSSFKPSLVVVTLGGNDAGFSTIGEMCVAPGDCSNKQDLWLNSLPQVAKNLSVAYDQISLVFPDTPVVVTPYPDPIDEQASCGDLALKGTERTFLGLFVSQLDQAIRSEASLHHFYFADTMEQALAASHLQLCDPQNDGQPGINFIGLRSVDGPPEQRFNPSRWDHSSFHPNPRGHAAMFATFEHWLSDTENGQPLQSLPPRTTTSAGPLPTATPVCQLTSNGPDGCRPQGNAWAERRLGFSLYTGGFLAIGAALGAWWAGVVFFAWRRRLLLT